MTEQILECQICSSPLVDGLNEKKNWQTARVIRWAQIRGLVIDENILTAHLGSHLANNGDEPPKKRSSKNRITEPIAETVKPPEQIDSALSTDEQFLNLIIQRIYDGVIGKQIDLKVEHAFKAIEIKQKLAESGNVENLLLELLNEIRKQELPK
jgi:hypothetical protein